MLCLAIHPASFLRLYTLLVSSRSMHRIVSHPSVLVSHSHPLRLLFADRDYSTTMMDSIFVIAAAYPEPALFASRHVHSMKGRSPFDALSDVSRLTVRTGLDPLDLRVPHLTALVAMLCLVFHSHYIPYRRFYSVAARKLANDCLRSFLAPDIHAVAPGGQMLWRFSYTSMKARFCCPLEQCQYNRSNLRSNRCSQV